MARKKRTKAIDRSSTSRIVVKDTPANRRKYDPRRVDFSGRDTKNGRKVRPKKIRKGKRGGEYVLVNGKRVYLPKK